MNKRLIIRIASLLVIILVCVFLFNIGKQHSILLDNKTVTINEQELKGFKFLEVQLDKNETQEMTKNERIEDKVMAQTHKITVVYTENNTEKEFTTKFKLPLMEKAFILSIPTMIAYPDTPEIWIKPFI